MPMLSVFCVGDVKAWSKLQKAESVAERRSEPSDLKWKAKLESKSYKIAISLKRHKDADVVVFFIPPLTRDNLTHYEKKVSSILSKTSKTYNAPIFLLALPRTQKSPQFKHFVDHFKDLTIHRVALGGCVKRSIELLLRSHLTMIRSRSVARHFRDCGWK